MFIGEVLLQYIILKAMGLNLPYHQGTLKVSYGEYLFWNSLWLLMSTSVGVSSYDYWRTKQKNVGERNAHYDLNEYEQKKI